MVPIEYNGIKYNFLDTPGYFDFVGEVEEALSVAACAVIVINAKAGVEVGTQKALGSVQQVQPAPRILCYQHG